MFRCLENSREVIKILKFLYFETLFLFEGIVLNVLQIARRDEERLKYLVDLIASGSFHFKRMTAEWKYKELVTKKKN